MIHEQFATSSPLVAFLSKCNRATVEAVAEISIALLDDQDGDCDIEGDRCEDDITDAFSQLLKGAFGPGCEMSDPGEYSDEHLR